MALALTLAAVVALAGGTPDAGPLPDPTATGDGQSQPLRARAAHTATLLDDGRVLIAGGCAVDGCGTSEVAPSSEFFVPGTGFMPGPDMLHPRAGHNATRLGDGRVLIVGGWAREGTRPLAEAEVFNPATGAFEPAGTLPSGHGGHAALLADGRVLVAGGEAASSVQFFDPLTNTWTVGPALPEVRDAAVAITLDDGRVLIAGGRDTAGRGVTSAVVFDPVANAWARVGDMATPRYKHAMVNVDGRVLVLGGTTDDAELLASTEYFDPATGQFTPGPPMSQARYKFIDSVVALPDRVVVAAGTGVDVLVDGRFVAVPDVTHAIRWFSTATPLADGSVLVVGGYDDRIRVYADALYVDA
jgi:hypothetical protein